MLIKLDARLEALIAEGRIKNRWSEVEDYGLVEMVHIIFDNDLLRNSIAATPIIENRVVSLNLHEGVIYEHEGETYTLTRACLDIDSNIIFASTNGELFLYETDILDAEDPKHYFGNE